MSKKAYRATRVNDVNWDQIARGREGVGVTLGVDVGKFDVLVVCRWADGRFERPWRIKNPWEIPTLVALVRQVKTDRKLVMAMSHRGPMEMPYDRRWGTTGSRSGASMARRPMIMRRCSTGSLRNTTAKMQRWSPNWRRWARPSPGRIRLLIPGRR